MNVLAPKPAGLAIEVVHDLVCPWCYLGVRRLCRTIARRTDLRAEITWRPFLLNPDMPRGGMPRTDYIMRKFGGEERARRLYASIAELGRAEGVMFRFDRIRCTPSSVDAHRLVRWAQRFGRADEVVEALFAAHFADGRDIVISPFWQQLQIVAACAQVRRWRFLPVMRKWTVSTLTI